MNGHTTITIPPALFPSDGRFGSGPSRVDQAAVIELASAATTFLGTSHRKARVKDVVASIQHGLAALYELPDGYEVVLGVGGATAFWDASAYGLIDRRSAHFVCGEFSGKFASVTAGAPHLANPVVIAAEYGSAPEPRPVGDTDVTAFIHNETSTGVLAPFTRFEDELVVVDGTSAAGAIPFDLSTVDAYYFSPQKALGSEGGLWIAIMSPAATGRIEALGSSERWVPPFLSLAIALDNSRKHQTYNTPALTTLFLLEHQISTTLADGGLEAAAARASRSSQHLYRWAEERPYTSPFVSEARFRSPTVVTIDLAPEIPADDLTAVLERHGILDIGGYRKLGRNQIRIATFPSIPTSDIESLTACIDHVAEAM